MISKREIEIMEKSILLSADMRLPKISKSFANGYRAGVEDMAKILKELCVKDGKDIKTRS